MDYYALIISILLIVLAIFGKFVYRNFVNPITVFCGLWGAILLLYSFRCYEINKASEASITLTFVGCIAFFVGALLPLIRQSRSGHPVAHMTSVDVGSPKPNYLYFIILNIISIIFLMGFAVETIRLLRMGYGFDYIHYYYNQEVGTIGAERASQNVLNWFVWPLTLGTLPMIAAVIQCDSEKTKVRRLFLITSIINVVIYVIVTGARASIAYILVYFVFVYLLQGRKIQMKLSRRIGVLIAGMAVIWAFNYITISRGSDSVLKTVYIYFCGCVPNFSVRFENIMGYDKMHGLVSTYGFYRPILLIVNRLLHSSSLYTLRNTIDALIRETQNRVLIGTSIRYNAFVSPFYYFILDGGYIGVIILSILYGMLCTSTFIKYTMDRSYKNLMIYLLVIYGLAFSMVRFHFVQMRYVLSFFYVVLGFANLRLRFKINSKKQ